jgi:glycosyltransferase involved in cell wall biosynthesis
VKLSALVPTFNEERRIAACLEALSFADEIVLIDSFSTDRTVEVARRYTDRIFQRPWKGSNDQKEFARQQARGEWVLSVDADEIVTVALREEIAVRTARGDVAGFRIPVRTYYRDRWVKAGGLWPGYHLRLFRRELGHWEGTVEPHERVVLRGRTARLRAPLDHHSYEDLQDFLDKAHRHASLWAESQARAGRRAGAASLLARPAARFLRDYLVRGGFLQGGLGLLFCALQAHYTFLKYARLWEATREGAHGSSGSRGSDASPSHSR